MEADDIEISVAGGGGGELAQSASRRLATMLLNETTVASIIYNELSNVDSPGGGELIKPPTMIEEGLGSQSTWSLLITALFYKLDGFDVNWCNFILALILIMLMLTTAIGNLFVIVAILIERNLRTIGNYLVLSLAIADLLVACLVMPLAGIYQILERWTLGVLLCDIWTSADVFCCTASILHLLAIALDRYWAVTRVDYIRCQRNERRILLMIFFVWFAACIISLAPVFGWKDAQFELRITMEQECLISQDVGYQIFATCTTFYFPLTLTLIFYWKIYQVARKRIRRKPGSRVKISLQHPSSSSSNSSPALKQQHKSAQTSRSMAESSPAQSQNQGLKSSSQKQIGSKGMEPCQCSCHIQAARSLAERPNRLESAELGRVNFGPGSNSGANIKRALMAINHTQQLQQSSFDPSNISKTAANGSAGKPSDADGSAPLTNGSGDGGGADRSQATLNDNPTTTTTTTNKNNNNTARGDFSVDNQIFDTNNMEAGQSNGGAIQIKDRRRHSSSVAPGASVPLAGGKANSLTEPEEQPSSAADLTGDPTTGPASSPRGCSSDNDRKSELDGDNNSTTRSTTPTNNNSASKIAKTTSNAYCIRGPTTTTTTVTTNLAKCRHCHWAGQQKNCPFNGCLVKGAINGGSHYKSSLSSEIQSSCSPSPSLANGVTDYNGDTECRQHHRQLSVGQRGGFMDLDQQQHQYSPTTCPPMNFGACTDYLLDDCCGCCCAQSTTGPPPLTTGHNTVNNNQDEPVQQRDGMIALTHAGSALACPESYNNIDNTSGAHFYNRPLFSSSQVTLDERGGLVSELVAHPGEDSIKQQQQRKKSSSYVSDNGHSYRFRPVLGLLRALWLRYISGSRQPPLVGARGSTGRQPMGTILVATENGGHKALVIGETGCALCADNHLSTDGALVRASGEEELTGQDNAGAAIAASTAALAVTTVRPPMVTTNSVQMAAEGLESKRERKAAKTLAIITGVFVMCWLPFFVMAITMSLLNLRPHKYVFALMLWLGYVNSMLNPIIYTIFSPDFRKAFKRLLCGLDSREERRRQEGRPAGCRLNPHQRNSFDETSGTGCLIQMRQQIFRLPPMFVQCCLPNSVIIKHKQGNNPKQDSHHVLCSSNNTLSGNSNNLRNHLLNNLRGGLKANTNNNSASGTGIGPSQSVSLKTNLSVNLAQVRSQLGNRQQLSTSPSSSPLQSETLSHNQATKEHENLTQSPGRPQSSNIINDF